VVYPPAREEAQWSAGVCPLNPGTQCTRVEQAATSRHELMGPGVPRAGRGPHSAAGHRCEACSGATRRRGQGPRPPTGPGPVRCGALLQPGGGGFIPGPDGRRTRRFRRALPGGGATRGGPRPSRGTNPSGSRRWSFMWRDGTGHTNVRGFSPARRQAGQQCALCRAFHGVEGSDQRPGSSRDGPEQVKEQSCIGSNETCKG